MESWEIIILEEFEDGYLCSAPNGDTQWLTKEDYEKLKQKRPNEN
jgi:hypothetical protein